MTDPHTPARNRDIDALVASLVAERDELRQALTAMLDQGERCNWFADRGDEEVTDAARKALERP